MELERLIQVTENNLGRLKKQKYSVDTRRAAHIRELARSLVPYIPIDEDSSELFRPLYNEMTDKLDLSQKERAILCHHLTQENRISQQLLSLKAPKKKCTVSYVKNPLSDLAYDSFSGFFEKTTVSYASDFISGLEDVYHSVTDYVILPVYSEKSGRMKSFCDMADKYEMKKVLTCRVYSNAEETETEFALFSKSCERFSGKRNNVFFEFSIPESKILKSMICADTLGYNVTSVNTYESRADICFEITGGDADPLCIYLMLELPGYTVKGIY